MKICIPVIEDKGLMSEICGHFGSAPYFMLVDTASMDCSAVANGNQHHAHGMCQPLAALAGHEIGAIVVRGIGQGAINRLRAAGIEVYLGQQTTVEEVVRAFAEGALAPVSADAVCAHHGHHHAHGRGN